MYAWGDLVRGELESGFFKVLEEIAGGIPENPGRIQGQLFACTLTEPPVHKTLPALYMLGAEWFYISEELNIRKVSADDAERKMIPMAWRCHGAMAADLGDDVPVQVKPRKLRGYETHPMRRY